MSNAARGIRRCNREKQELVGWGGNPDPVRDVRGVHPAQRGCVVMRDKLPSLPTLAMLVWGLAAGWKGLYELAAFCLAAVFVLAYFDAKQEAAYRRAEGAGVSMRFNRFTDWLFDLTMSGLILLAALIMLGVI